VIFSLLDRQCRTPRLYSTYGSESDLEDRGRAVDVEEPRDSGGPRSGSGVVWADASNTEVLIPMYLEPPLCNSFAFAASVRTPVNNVKSLAPCEIVQECAWIWAGI
jgi:hypothetical protein